MATLKTLLPFKFGAAVNVDKLRNDTAYRAFVAANYSSITAENVMKMKHLHPAEDEWNFADADYLCQFAKDNGIRVHGHTLVWDSSMPEWMKTYTGDYKAMLKKHVQTVVSHFKGKVASWDAVNEPFTTSGTLENSIYKEKLGEHWINMVVDWAHSKDEKVKLFINDWGHENGNSKRRGIIKFVEQMIAEGKPIHGIGMQFHTRYNRGESSWASAINEVAALGLKVHIAEIDVAINPDGVKDFEPTLARLEAQAKAYEFIVRTYNALPATQKWGITTWNVTDGDSHLKTRPDWPLPFDKAYNTKPAYQGILDGIK